MKQLYNSPVLQEDWTYLPLKIMTRIQHMAKSKSKKSNPPVRTSKINFDIKKHFDGRNPTLKIERIIF